MVWDMVKGNCLNVLEGHSGEVRSVVLTRRGRSVLSFLSLLCRPDIYERQQLANKEGACLWGMTNFKE